MEFNLMDPFFHDKKPEKTLVHQLYQESPESSSDYEFSSATRITTSPPPLHFHTNPTLYIPNIETHINEVHAFQRTDYSMDVMREMIYRMAMMQPVQIDPEAVKPPKRKNVRISKDPQSVAARHRRERISERIRILQRMVPGGTKLDTASMLDEAVHYLKFLKRQLEDLELAAKCNRPVFSVMGSMQMI